MKEGLWKEPQRAGERPLQVIISQESHSLIHTATPLQLGEQTMCSQEAPKDYLFEGK